MVPVEEGGISSSCGPAVPEDVEESALVKMLVVRSAPPADPQDDRGGLLGRAKIMPPNIWDTQFTSGDVFASPPVYPSSSYTRIPTPSDNPDTGRIPERTSMGQPVPEDGDGGQGVIPTPRFLRSSSTGNSFDLMWRNFKNYGVDQQRLQIEEPHFDKFPTPQTLSCWKIKFKTEVCSSSNFPTEVMLWIKEVEMATSVDDLKIFAIYSGTYSFFLILN